MMVVECRGGRGAEEVRRGEGGGAGLRGGDRTAEAADVKAASSLTKLPTMVVERGESRGRGGRDSVRGDS
jgi:hypothetical protein